MMKRGGQFTTALLFQLPAGRGHKGCRCPLCLCSASQRQSRGLLRVSVRKAEPCQPSRRQRMGAVLCWKGAVETQPRGASSWGRMRGVGEKEGDADQRYPFVLLHCDCSCNSSDLPLCFIF